MIVYTPHEGIASLQIATDEQPYLGTALIPLLEEAVATIHADERARVLLVEGGDSYFSAGGSRERLLADSPESAVMDYVAALPHLILSLPVPTIAVMAGHAIGGGLAFGLWCDIPILAEESLYGTNFMALGITPGMGSTIVLEEAVGAPLARLMLFSGRLFTGRELRQSGGPLAHAIVAKEQVYKHALAIAQEIAEVPYQSLRLLKQTLAARRRALLESVLPGEREMHSIVFARPEVRAHLDERYMTSIHDLGNR